MQIRFWGVRGSIPCPGPSTARVGGNTSCVEVRAAGHLLIFDLGTGARALGASLLAGPVVRAHVFLSHLHHDHTQGLPFFAPCFLPGASLDFYGAEKAPGELGEALHRDFDYPYFPVPLKNMAARKEFFPVTEGRRIALGPDLGVVGLGLNHPDGAMGYRVEAREGGVDKVFSYCTDTESSAASDTHVLSLARGADVLVMDAQYTDEEYPSKVGWGHSTVTQAARMARQAGVRKLYLFHHDPSHDDEKIKAMEEQAREHFPEARAAVEGLQVEV